MGKSRFIELMAKSIGKSATEDELKELELFLEQYPEYRKMQTVANALKVETKHTAALLRERDLNAGFSNLWDKIGEAEADEAAIDATEGIPLADKITAGTTIKTDKRNIYGGYQLWAAAAAVLIVCLTGFYFYANISPRRPDYTVMNTIYVPFGKTRELILPDGTRLRLNSGSTITYPQSFAANKREVTLQGEGFFEVTKNRKRPFLVVTDHLTVKVLGTVFNVKAYADDKNTETTLLRGKVQVELKDRPEKSIILLPNEKLVVMNDSPDNDNIVNDKEARTEYQLKKLPNIKPEDIKETAWLSNRMVFINENFEGVAKQMERKYNVQIIFDDQVLKTEQISGVLEKESLENALGIIKLTTPFKFKTEGRTIHISHQ
ncbi:FecR family protein [Pedobacter westerhofensis]|uniref:FecR family protein n=1 Tax=Pedobacter westerhofensis TaxID=425512 RepID=A0A521CQU8_9SPHI|nr:FecR family protein [Pedobacter westerhofensis]SMO61778.1 FecR family protein [Pedobacter westerhofensis]